MIGQFFEYRGEWFLWTPCEDEGWEGFYEITDSEDCLIGIVDDPRVAVEATQQEVDWWHTQVESCMKQIGEWL